MVFDPNAAATEDSGVFGLPHSAEEASVILIPVPFDATTSYRAGTHKGPEAILEASKQVDLDDRQTGKPYKAGIHMLPISEQLLAWNTIARKHAEVVIARGGAEASDADVQATNAYSEKVNTWVYEQAREWLAKGKRVGTIGGDHAVPFGAIKAHAEKYPGMGLLHLDAHADLRDAYEGFTFSHASIMHNVLERIDGVARLVQVGIRDFGENEMKYIEKNKKLVTHFDADLTWQGFDGVPWKKLVDKIVADLPSDVYLSFDIDGLDPALCPNTGTPVPGGLSFHQAVALIEGVRRAGKRIVGMDLCEVAPGQDEWDANVGARLLYKMIGFQLL